MATYIRFAHKAEKYVGDLGVARNRVEIASKVTAVRVLNKGTGSFTLTFIFYDGTQLDLNQDEISNGDMFQWDVERLLLTNTAQAGLQVKLLFDVQISA